MYQYENFEKQYKFETKQLVDYVYKSLADGNSVAAVEKDLIYKGIPEADAAYIASYIYRKKRWQIAWERAGGGARLIALGLGNMLLAFIILSSGFFVSSLLRMLYTQFSVWLGNGIMIVALIIFATGTLTSLWGAFRLFTAAEDSMRGCLIAALAGAGILLLGLLGYWLVISF